MRPVSLTVSGLQSFRETQTIPFSDLCSGGVFGIFGPTGSGKSTILDAVTLALYGKVERAASGTHGIMNQAEDKLSVSFTFQIGQGAAQKHYTVERSYKRSGEHTIRTSTSRLIEVNGEDAVVHADKERDVTRLVQELLGLTIEDFTRAVVLPQGKFAEFLSLKGADRRQMLQRLFQLEKYGDVLNQKLKRRSDEQKNRLNEINAEQAGLGDASSEALKEAANILKENEQKLQNVSDRLKKDEEKVTTLKSYWDIQNENEKLLKMQKELNNQKPEMELLKERLKQALYADRLYPYAKEWQESIKTENKLSQEKDELQKRRNDLEAKLVESEKEFESAKAIKNKEEPILIEKRSGLKDAFEWEKELSEKQHHLKQEEEKHKELLQSYQKATKTEEDAAQKLQRGKDKQTLLKTELTSIEISQKERAVLQRALLLFQQFQSAAAEKAKVQNELTQTENSVSAIVKNNNEVQKRLTGNQDKWISLSNEVQRLYGDVCEAIRENEQIAAFLQNELTASKANQEQLRIKHLAAQLSAQLKENEPCAVCGSTIHPSPVPELEQFDDQQRKVDYLESGKESLKRLHHDLIHVSESLEKVSEKIWNKLGSKNVETAAARDALTLETAELIAAIEKEQVNNHTTRVKGLLQDRLTIEERFDSLLLLTEENQKQLERISFEKESTEKQLQKLTEELSSVNRRTESLQNEWDKADIPFERNLLTEKQQEFQKREERQDEIHKSLEVAVPFLEEQSTKMEKAKDEKIKLELDLNTSINQQKLLKKDIEILQEKLVKRIGENSAQEQFMSVEKQLKDLLEKFKTTEENYGKVREQFLDSDKSYHSILQRYADAEKRKTTAETEWNNQLKKSMFSTFEEYESCLTKEEEQQNWEQNLTRFNDQYITIQTSIDSLKPKLPSESLKEGQLLFAVDQLKKIKLETDELREAVGQSRQNWLTIERNHTRFKELDREKLKVSALLEQIGKLQTVFRGNTFVEFMAEEQLIHVTRDASSRLSKLTRGRYAIEVDSNSGFVIRDDANGGIKRPVSSLSGGETFLTSLALALSLSAQIQLRGKYPLQFFFLDEGFGTLDQGLLDTVVTALEKVQMENFAIGVISHVPELKARLTKRLIVEPAEHSGRGTRVRLDQL